MAISKPLHMRSYRPLMTEKNKNLFSRENYLVFKKEHNLLALSGNEKDLLSHPQRVTKDTAISLILPDMSLDSIHVKWFDDDSVIYLTPMESFVQAYGAIEGYQRFEREISRPPRLPGQFGATFQIELMIDIFTGLVKAHCTCDNPLVVPLGFKLNVQPRYMF